MISGTRLIRLALLKQGFSTCDMNVLRGFALTNYVDSVVLYGKRLGTNLPGYSLYTNRVI